MTPHQQPGSPTFTAVDRVILSTIKGWRTWVEVWLILTAWANVAKEVKPWHLALESDWCRLNDTSSINAPSSNQLIRCLLKQCFDVVFKWSYEVFTNLFDAPNLDVILFTPFFLVFGCSKCLLLNLSPPCLTNKNHECKVLVGWTVSNISATEAGLRCPIFPTQQSERSVWFQVKQQMQLLWEI